VKKLILSIFIFLYSFSSVPAIDLKEPAWVYQGIGDRFYRRGEIGKAIVAYKKALIRRKETKGNGTTIGFPEVNLKLGKIYLNEGLYDLAIIQLALAEKQKAFLQVPNLIYEILYTKAELFFIQEKYNDSMNVYQFIIKDDINWDRYSKENQYEIIKKFIKNRELQNKYGRAHFEIGKIKYISKNFDNAIPHFKMAIMYQYKPELTVEYLVNCYENLENHIMAERVIEIFKKI